MAKKNDFIRIDEIGDAFRHSGQNPTEDIIKDMTEKAKLLKISNRQEEDEGWYISNTLNKFEKQNH